MSKVIHYVRSINV